MMKILTIDITGEQESFFGNIDDATVVRMGVHYSTHFAMDSAKAKSDTRIEQDISRDNDNFIAIRVFPPDMCITEFDIFPSPHPVFH